jgi:hypothetical protein
MVDLCLDYLCVEDCCEVFCLNNLWRSIYLLQRSIKFFRGQIDSNIRSDNRILTKYVFKPDYIQMQTLPLNDSLPPLPFFKLLPRTTIRLLLTIVIQRQIKAKNLRNESCSESECGSESESDNLDLPHNKVKRGKSLSLQDLDIMESKPRLRKYRIHDIVGDTATNTFVGPERLVNGIRFIVLLYY